MKELQPSMSDWRNLYNAAIEFKKTGCWEWMLDSDVFGVQNPVTGEIGYCCIMGYLGAHLALAVYQGTDGLETYLKMQRGKLPENEIELLMLQKCLMASFEDREILSEKDREIISELGLKFRGRQQWPLFRSYRPGYHPWYLTRDEAEYLTLSLQQAEEVALRFKEDRDILKPSKKSHYLVRVPGKKGDRLEWEDKWLKPEPRGESKISVPPIDGTFRRSWGL